MLDALPGHGTVLVTSTLIILAESKSHYWCDNFSCCGEVQVTVPQSTINNSHISLNSLFSGDMFISLIAETAVDSFQI